MHPILYKTLKIENSSRLSERSCNILNIKFKFHSFSVSRYIQLEDVHRDIISHCFRIYVWKSVKYKVILYSIISLLGILAINDIAYVHL